MNELQVLEQTKQIFDQLKLITIDGSLFKKDSSRKMITQSLERLETKYSFLFICRNKKEVYSTKNLAKELDLAEYHIHECQKGELSSQIIFNYYDREINPLYINHQGFNTRIEAGKSILSLTSRTNRFISPFKKPQGIKCHSFLRIVWGTGCPFDCSYCYLQLTYRITPFIKQYLNLEKLFREIDRVDQQADRPIVLNSGELADSLAMDPIFNYINVVGDKIAKTKNLFLLLLTKANTVEHLDSIDHERIIFSSSLTIPSNRKKYEHNTATIDKRIGSLKIVANKGYRIRLRIDPIFIESDYDLEEYYKLIDKIRDLPIEIITLGQPRFYPSLLAIIRTRNPEDYDYFKRITCSKTEEGRTRVSEKERTTIYRNLAGYCNEMIGVKPAICKEDITVNKNLKKLLGRRCNCI